MYMKISNDMEKYVEKIKDLFFRHYDIGELEPIEVIDVIKGLSASVLIDNKRLSAWEILSFLKSNKECDMI